MTNHFLLAVVKSRAQAATLEFSRADSQRLLAGSVELAFDSASRKRGLLGRDALESGRALAIAPCCAIHTFAMRFAIDVMFLAKDGRVLKIARALKPGRIALCLTAFAVVEMAAGEAARAGLGVGDTLVAKPVTT